MNSTDTKYDKCENPKIIRTNIPISNEYREFVLRTYTDTELKKQVRSYALYYAKLAIVVPCGHCMYCRSKIARTWAYRIVLESRNPVRYNACYFLTLTFRDRSCDVETDKWTNITSSDDHKLIYENVKRFLKILRKRRIMVKGDKYFCVGEYGDTRKHGDTVNHSKHRFHYHIVLWLQTDIVQESDRIIEQYQSVCADRFTGTGKNRRLKTNHELNAEMLFLSIWNTKRQIHHKEELEPEELEKLTFYDKPDDCILFCSDVSSFGETAWYVGKYCTCSSIDKDNGYIPYHHQSKGLGEWYAIEHRHQIYNGEMRVLTDIRDNGYFYPIPRTWLKKYGNILKQREDFLSLYPQTIEELRNKYDLSDSQCEMLNEFGITTCYELLERYKHQQLGKLSVSRCTYALAEDLYRGYQQTPVKDLNEEFSFKDIYPVGKCLASLIPYGYKFNGFFNAQGANTTSCRNGYDRFLQCTQKTLRFFYYGLW